MASKSLERTAFWVTVLLVGATVWIAPRLPLADLPQHAGQIALWHDLVRGASPWQSLVYVNWFTPYLVGCALALLLSFVLPVSAALKLLLMLAYFAFVGACVLLHRRLGGDRRLDWLFVPGFFGLAYLYGFFPFLVALPIGVAFMVLAHRHAERPTSGSGALLTGAGAILFFTHGLVFLFAGLSGGAFLLLATRSFRRLLAAAVPYAALGLLCSVYFLLNTPGNAVFPVVAVPVRWETPFNALNYLLFFPMGMPGRDWTDAPLVPLLLCVPWLLGCRIDWQNKAALVPIGALLLWMAIMPEEAFETFFVDTRFVALFLPFYALMFTRAPVSVKREATAVIGMAALCWAFLAIQATRQLAFATESHAFEEVLAAADPGQQAKQYVFDPASNAALSPMAYTNYPLWYQAEKGGLVDFNFALFPTQVVRYREKKAEGATPGRKYRYYFVRSTRPLPADLFSGDACRPVLRKKADTWFLFESEKC